MKTEIIICAFIFLYTLGGLYTDNLVARDAVWCHKARWEHLPVNGLDISIMTRGALLFWPMVLRDVSIAYELNDKHYCMLGGKK